MFSQTYGLIFAFVTFPLLCSGLAHAGNDGAHIYAQSVKVVAVERAPLKVRLVAPQCLVSKPALTEGVAIAQLGPCTSDIFRAVELCYQSSVRDPETNARADKTCISATSAELIDGADTVDPMAMLVAPDRVWPDIAELTFDPVVLAKEFGLTRETIEKEARPDLTLKTVWVDADFVLRDRDAADRLLEMVHKLGPSPSLEQAAEVLKLNLEKVKEQLGSSPTIKDLIFLRLDPTYLGPVTAGTLGKSLDIPSRPIVLPGTLRIDGDVRTTADGQQWAVYETAVGKYGLSIRSPASGAPIAICMNAPMMNGHPVLRMNSAASINVDGVFEHGPSRKLEDGSIEAPVFFSVGEPKRVTSSCIEEPLQTTLAWYEEANLSEADAVEFPASIAEQWNGWNGDMDKLFTDSSEGGLLLSGDKYCPRIKYKPQHETEWLVAAEKMGLNRKLYKDWNKNTIRFCEYESKTDVRATIFHDAAKDVSQLWSKDEQARFKDFRKQIKKSSSIEVDWRGADKFMCGLQQPMLDALNDLNRAQSPVWFPSSEDKRTVRGGNLGLTNARSPFAPPSEVVGEDMVCRFFRTTQKHNYDLSDQRALGINFVPVTIAYPIAATDTAIVQEFTDKPITQTHLKSLYGL